MKEELIKLKDEFVTVFNTRLAWLLVGLGLGSGGDVAGMTTLLRGFLGV